MSLKKTVFPYYCGIPRPAGCMASDLLATRFTMIGCILRRQDWPATPFLSANWEQERDVQFSPLVRRFKLLLFTFLRVEKMPRETFFSLHISLSFFFSTTFFFHFSCGTNSELWAIIIGGNLCMYGGGKEREEKGKKRKKLGR